MVLRERFDSNSRSFFYPLFANTLPYLGFFLSFKRRPLPLRRQFNPFLLKVGLPPALFFINRTLWRRVPAKRPWFGPFPGA
jgi:hypothetical protein